MSDDFNEDDLPQDPGVNIANGIVVVTGLVLILAIYTMNVVADQLYDTGWLAQ
jgi:hypothetical protein